jgi:hypothetical protein
LGAYHNGLSSVRHIMNRCIRWMIMARHIMNRCIRWMIMARHIMNRCILEIDIVISIRINNSMIDLE